MIAVAAHHAHDLFQREESQESQRLCFRNSETSLSRAQTLLSAPQRHLRLAEEPYRGDLRRWCSLLELDSESLRKRLIAIIIVIVIIMTIIIIVIIAIIVIIIVIIVVIVIIIT